MSDEQQAVVRRVVAAPGQGGFPQLRAELATAQQGLWLPPPLLTVAAALITVIVHARRGDVPWQLEESFWEEYLPDRMPTGRSEWRNANYAVHAAGCLAAGIWLDVGRQESFWHLPLWPFALDLVELLTNVAAAPPTRLTADQLHERLQAHLLLQS